MMTAMPRTNLQLVLDLFSTTIGLKTCSGLNGPSQSHLCFCLHARVCYYILFTARRSKGNHCGTATDNQTHFPEHNLQ